MKRKEFFHLVQPLTEKLYQFAYSLIPDDLQAEQLVIDAVNAYLLKEKKWITAREVDLANKKSTQILRKTVFKSVLKYMADIGQRRALQLTEQMRLTRPAGYDAFYNLDPKVRMTLRLRYEAQFSVEDITEILQIPRYEVIEKIHNGRFLLLNDLGRGIPL
jgi:DNA-directed RNA polymerase specialized sigma24 family protein